jgi:nucleotide-binding universal stress UspA family protein
MTEHPSELASPESEPTARAAEQAALRRARAISQRWGSRLDEFDLPCPVCEGKLEFHGLRRDPLFEFAEGEPGVVEPLELYALTFICNRCGYAADFDAELFNPAYLAGLAGANSEQVAALSLRRTRVLVPLHGDERSDTLLDLATALVGNRGGEVIVLDTGENEALEAVLQERLERYRPMAGDPAPTTVVRQGRQSLSEALQSAIAREQIELLLLNARGHGSVSERALPGVVRGVLKAARSDIVLVYDRGLPEVTRILFATSGGPSARAAAPFAVNMARAFDAALHLLYIAPPDTPQPDELGRQHMAETMSAVEVDEKLNLQRRIVVSADPVAEVINQAASYDLLILGGSPDSWRLGAAALSSKLARNAPATTLVMLSREAGPQPWWRRLIG